MKYYNDLLALGCFSLNDVCHFIPNKDTAKNMLKEYIKNGFIERVKRNYYVVMDIVNHSPLHSKYVVASKLDSSSYIAYHSALEYYGFYNQVMNEVIFCGNKRYNEFDYDGNTYHYVNSKCELQIEENYDGSKVTSLERTVVDCIDHIELAGGIEELYRALDAIPSLDEKQLLEILDFYDKKILYQRSGYILSYFKEQLKLSDEFISYLHSKINKSVCYLVSSTKKEKTYFDTKWNVCVPLYVDQILTKGGNDIEV